MCGSVQGGESLRRARVVGDRAPHPEQGPEQVHPLREPRHRGHALQARRPRSPRQPEQHRLGLIVERVAGQHGDRGESGCLGSESRIARAARGGLGAAARTHLDPDDARLEPERLGLRGCRGRGIRRSLLETVIDGDGDGPQPRLRRLECGGGGEGEGVRTAGEGDDDRRARLDPAQGGAHGQPHLGDGGIQARTNGHPSTVVRRLGNRPQWVRIHPD